MEFFDEHLSMFPADRSVVWALYQWWTEGLVGGSLDVAAVMGTSYH